MFFTRLIKPERNRSFRNYFYIYITTSLHVPFINCLFSTFLFVKLTVEWCGRIATLLNFLKNLFFFSDSFNLIWNFPVCIEKPFNLWAFVFSPIKWDGWPSSMILKLFICATPLLSHNGSTFVCFVYWEYMALSRILFENMLCTLFENKFC